MRPLALFAVWVVASLALPAGAAAQTQASFAVSASIVPGCAVATAAGGEWGRIDLGNVPGTSRQVVEADLVGGAGSGVAIECTPGTQVSVTADAGLHPDNGQRQLANQGNAAAQRLAYRLLLQNGTVDWGGQAIALGFTTSQPTRRIDVRGRAVLPGSLAAGRYTDTVRVTIAW